jgi:hypothetical protein
VWVPQKSVLDVPDGAVRRKVRGELGKSSAQQLTTMPAQRRCRGVGCAEVDGEVLVGRQHAFGEPHDVLSTAHNADMRGVGARVPRRHVGVLDTEQIADGACDHDVSMIGMPRRSCMELNACRSQRCDDQATVLAAGQAATDRSVRSQGHARIDKQAG